MSVVWDTEALAALVESGGVPGAVLGTRLRTLLATAHGCGRHRGRIPQIGRIVPEYGLPQMCELIVERVRLIYRLGPDGVEVLTLWNPAIPMGNQ